MNCPKGHGSLAAVKIESIPVSRCSKCGGTWYNVEELRVLKDKEADGDYCWIDFDLWKDRDKFRAARQQHRSCPRRGHPMTTVHYGDSAITIDICSECKGVWLDKTEYDEIVAYLDKMVNTQTVGDYLRDLRDEFVEIFTGPEGPISEFKDADRVFYLLQLRFAAGHPGVVAAAQALPKF